LKKGDVLELKIEKYAFEGKGLAKINKQLIVPSKEEDSTENNYVVFVNGSYPGDIVTARLLKIKKSYAEAIAVEILSPSNYRTDPKCKYFGTCGGCRQQDLQYEMQTIFKQQQVIEIFERLGGFKDFTIEDIIPSDKIFYYRNKMEFSFADKRWLTKAEINNENISDKNFALGLHIPRIFDKVLDIDVCYLQSELSVKIVNFTREFFKKKDAAIYSTKIHMGYLRNLVIKQSHHTDDLMVNLVTGYDDENLMNEYTQYLLKEIPQISTVINNINLKKASVATGDYEKVYHGSGFIYDLIGNYKFRISANSFFQTNTLMAEKLYDTASEFADLKGDEIVYDLYSGAGTISIFISEKAKHVYGFESIESSINDAAENSKINKIKNVDFIQADLYKSFLPIIEQKNIPIPDVVISDPPRSGMHTNTVSDVIKLNPKKIVYVSCNPTTQARDIKLFSEAGYKLIKIRSVDMFPHTFHIENAALLARE
jgi:23S rRNA (uracil1939-C5)-methyltransferase